MQSVTFKSFQKRMNLINLPKFKEEGTVKFFTSIHNGKFSFKAKYVMSDSNDIIVYIEAFDNVLKSIGWTENKLLEEIDKNWFNSDN